MSPETPTILVLGASGQVGWELQRSLAPLGSVVGAAPPPHRGPMVDLTRPETLAALLVQVRPAAVVNAAAYTAVDRAEQEPRLAAAINAEAVGELGRLAAAAGIPVIHYSTDFVFAGDAQRPYREDDPPGPLGVYGETKLAGEHALAASGAVWLVLRTSWVYGVRGHNFLLTMRRLFQGREDVRVVDDQTGAPTWARLIAEVTAQILGRALYGGLELAQVQGIYHLSGAGSTTWYGFARAVHERYGGGCRLLPIPTSAYPTPAHRPAYSVLDNGKLARVLGIRLPHWRESLEQCLDDLG
jgi:dTDP-4-dehydrorhamnose reductase